LSTCWAALGYNYWLAGEPQKAISAYLEALSGFREHDAYDYIPEVYAYMGLAHLALGDKEKANELTQKALVTQAQGEFTDIALEYYYARGVYFEVVGNLVQAEEMFRLGFNNAIGLAESIEESAARKAFFERDPTIRRLMDRVYHYGICESPEDGVVQRRVSGKFRTDIEVSWTVNAGAADTALKNASGAISLRRERIKRLLHEASEQGAAPTYQELAQELGVSVRTIIRDMQEIRQ
jgi:tetratricopeptide (TPR) repeat protein